MAGGLMGSIFRSTGVVLAIVSTLGACSSDSKASTTSAGAATNSTAAAAADTTIPSTTVSSVEIASTTVAAQTTLEPATTTSTAVPVELASVCTLVTPELVAGVLGAASTDAGTEQVFEPTYKNCRWATTPPAGANANALEIAVFIRKSPSDPGFSPSNDIGNPVPVDGVGDDATYANNGQTGFEVAQLIADKGLAAVAITLRYGGTTPHGPDLQGAVSEIARQIFSQLNG